jgi:hypothetical protein
MKKLTEPNDFVGRERAPGFFGAQSAIARACGFDDRSARLTASPASKDKRIELTELLERFVRTNSQGVGPN